MPYPSPVVHPSPVLYPGIGFVRDPPEGTPPDLLSDLPPYEQDSYDIQGALRALAGELGRVQAAIDLLIANLFPGSADMLLPLFEALTGLTVNPDLAIDQRRKLVLSHYRNFKSQNTGLAWEANVTALLGTQWEYHEHDPNDSTSPPPYRILLRMPYAAPAAPPSGLTATPGGGGSLVAGHTYYYGVTALTRFGETPVSAVAHAVAPANGSMALSWTESTASGIIGYNVYRGDSATALGLLVSVTARNYTDAGALIVGLQGPPLQDSSAGLISALARTYARRITPAHIEVDIGYKQGFLIGISLIGEDVL